LGQSEFEYAKCIQAELGGALEFVTSDKSRVDLVTSTHAFEIDFASKWKESIGQSLWYALQTNKKAGIILILESKSGFRYVQKLQSAIDHNGLSDKIEVMVYPDDFKSSFPCTDNKSSALYGTSKQFWLSKNSRKRHNSNCKWFEKSKGRFSSANEGKAAVCCGG